MLCEECKKYFNCQGVCDEDEFLDAFEMAGYLDPEPDAGPIPLDERFV